ncbi:hypothetical protein [Halalkalibacter alkaliphilus]|uniref:Resolvase HTH domain-containing protein n=1 Tax=Halalkalibacter alkaliphilus TaxID=2917993 RepID=A0A9X2CRN1_9BACI|nr:hypothetical protein [Halalkalibacter alkaliphilus]MCL7746624.1 hypothetical protein [Halalkalibacter alkaliphilus]
MMEWALAILFGSAILLLILSFSKTRQSQKAAQQELEQFSISIMEEVYQLQKKMRDFELDAEISANEKGKQSVSPKQRILMREVLDLHKRGYSLEGIATETELTENEVRLLLTPYLEEKDERRKVANDS